jgi:hypothetical protein
MLELWARRVLDAPVMVSTDPVVEIPAVEERAHG